MKVKKILHRYYEKQLQEIEDIDPMVLQLRLKAGSRRTVLSGHWSDILGYLLIAGILLHYFLIGSFFAIVRIIPGIGVLF